MHVIRDDLHVIKNITETRRHAPIPHNRVEYADTITCSLSLQAVAFHDSPAEVFLAAAQRLPAYELCKVGFSAQIMNLLFPSSCTSRHCLRSIALGG